ncbi:MAG: hypothetical protein WC997_10765 [Porticoccaceae bacterium]
MFSQPTTSPFRLRNGFVRLAAQGAAVLLLAVVACLTLGFELGDDDVLSSPPVTLEGDNSADSVPDGDEARSPPLLLIVRETPRFPHHSTSLRERDAITARAQGPPVVNSLFI